MVLEWNGVERRKKRKENERSRKESGSADIPFRSSHRASVLRYKRVDTFPGVRNLSNDRSNRKMQNKVMRCHFPPRELAKLDSDNTQCWMDEH